MHSSSDALQPFARKDLIDFAASEDTDVPLAVAV
jgi:hypothetical protein